MTRGRSAMLMLITCILLVAPSGGPQSTESSDNSTHALITGHSGTLIVWPHSPRQSGRATFSRFTPWRNRLKTVLKETKPEIVESCDFGSAILPGRLVISEAIELVDCHLHSRPPLRC
jgi:hypothetical protein